MTFMETNRLRLRNVAVKDAEIMYDYRNNEICARYQRGQVKTTMASLTWWNVIRTT